LFMLLRNHQEWRALADALKNAKLRLGRRYDDLSSFFVGAAVLHLQQRLLQDMCEIRFRSYFRERATDFQVLDAITTFEDSKHAYQSTLDLLHHTPDLVGLFIAGGGKSGVLRGLREDAGGLAKTLNVVGLDLTPEARSGLLNGVVDVILSHPIKSLAETTVELLASATTGEMNGQLVQRLLPFEIYTPENL
jgi:LacI family transcriptional regulator